MDADTSAWLDPWMKLGNVYVSINIMSQKKDTKKYKLQTNAEKRKREEQKDEELNKERKDKVDVVEAEPNSKMEK